MRELVLSISLVVSSSSLAAETPLRFSIADSWSMPLVNIVNRQPNDGILFDIMQSLARQVGRTAEYHVLPRLRVQAALERGEVNVRCYAAQAWTAGLSGDYTWSLPILIQRDVLVAVNDDRRITSPAQLAPGEVIGTVLGYSYPVLQPFFNRRQLIREDARNQDQVLKKLAVGRYQYAVANKMALDWYNRIHPGNPPLRTVTQLTEQPAGCIVRNDPDIPVQRLLRVLVRMSVSGELQRIIDKYTAPLPRAGASLSQ
ncbi:transporter substrate-binding domain-containing protein [Pseudomonas sp. G.S.17]|uniref:substrate-binding periplasmic protein n=1 Tax=Pseudomonas sp. G.S.17 TaxID=3137451 RepID=UPI00311CBAA8